MSVHTQTLEPKGGAIAEPTLISAYCGPGGVICFNDAGITPHGFTEIVRGPRQTVRRQMEILARHAHQRGVLLVPGMPEAIDEVDAKEALRQFIVWSSNGRHMTHTLVWNHKCEVKQ